MRDGTAAVYYDNLSTDIKTNYRSLIDALQNRYKEELNFNLISIKQKPNETAEEYMSRALKISTDLKLEESILISLIINGLNDQIKRQVIVKEPKSLPDLTKFLKLCEVTNTLSVNVMETKFDKLLDEMQNLKIQMKETQEVSLLLPTDQYQQGYKQTSRDYVRSNRYTNRRNVCPNDSQYDNFAYKKPRTIRRFTVKPQLISHTQCCTKCGLDSCRFGKLCPAFNKACHVCGRMGHFRSQCFTGKK
ncbi:hypothetical protein ACF0H5_019480 [Mactra antiquata]